MCVWDRPLEVLNIVALEDGGVTNFPHERTVFEIGLSCGILLNFVASSCWYMNE